MVRDRPPASTLAAVLASYPSCATACSTRRRVFGATPAKPLSTRETVITETPARAATSDITARRDALTGTLPRDPDVARTAPSRVRRRCGVRGADRVRGHGTLGLDDHTAAETPGVADLVEVSAVQDGGRLNRGTGRHEFGLVRHDDRASGEVGDDAAVGGAVRGASNEEHAARSVSERIGSRQQVAHHA